MMKEVNQIREDDCIGVFLSSNDQVPESYITATQAFGEWLGRTHRTLVYGGSACGLMEVLAKAVKTSGGKVVGILPRIQYTEELISTYLDVHIPTADMADRKREMIERSRILVALPGGVGTIDEIFTVLSMQSIGYDAPSVILYNVEGCWDSLLNMLEDFYRRGMLRSQPLKVVKVANSLAELQALILAA